MAANSVNEKYTRKLLKEISKNPKLKNYFSEKTVLDHIHYRRQEDDTVLNIYVDSNQINKGTNKEMKPTIFDIQAYMYGVDKEMKVYLIGLIKRPDAEDNVEPKQLYYWENPASIKKLEI